MSAKIVEAKTVQTGAIKQCNEALKEILTDANIEWNEKGLKIITLDPSNTILVHLKLERENFEYFYCKHKISVGINVLNLFKLLRTLTNNDALTLFIEEDNINQLGIRIENGEKNTLTTYYLCNMTGFNNNIFISYILRRCTGITNIPRCILSTCHIHTVNSLIRKILIGQISISQLNYCAN